MDLIQFGIIANVTAEPCMSKTDDRGASKETVINLPFFFYPKEATTSFLL